MDVPSPVHLTETLMRLFAFVGVIVAVKPTMSARTPAVMA